MYTRFGAGGSPTTLTGGGNPASGTTASATILIAAAGASFPSVSDPGTGSHGTPLISLKSVLSTRALSGILLKDRARKTPTEVPTKISSERSTIPKKMPSNHLSTRRDTLFPLGK